MTRHRTRSAPLRGPARVVARGQAPDPTRAPGAPARAPVDAARAPLTAARRPLAPTRKPLAQPPRPTAEAPRRVEGAAAGRRAAYPSARQALSDPGARATLRAAAVWRGGLAAGVAAAALAGGCAKPECQPTTLGEAAAHTRSAFGDLARLEPRAALAELGVGFGLVPHTSLSVAGAMKVVHSAGPLWLEGEGPDADGTGADGSSADGVAAGRNDPPE
jgi:hypothetical protein